jgi:hypothetical protein
MTDWLDAEQVKADGVALMANPCCKWCVERWEQTTALRIVRAIAALPEDNGGPSIPGQEPIPAADYHDDLCHGDKPVCCSQGLLRRIWLACRAAVGEETDAEV